MSQLDPDGPGVGDGLFGLDRDPRTAAVQVIAVPWEATASYGRGTRHGPAAVLRASGQIDLSDLDWGEPWREGIGLLGLDGRVEELGTGVDSDARAVIDSGGAHPDLAARVDHAADIVNGLVEEEAEHIFAQGRIPAVLGGDHSTPYGLHRAACRQHPGIGFLHIDAHADLRDAYLGFAWSHASIFHNTAALPGFGRQVGVGWRDLGRAERERIASDERIHAFTDDRIGAALCSGRHWTELVAEIIAALPPIVHISVDVDGLDPALCPNTGTPVPGGLSWHQLEALLRAVGAARRVVSFDLVEVAPDRWPLAEGQRDSIDAIVGARLLYKLAGCALASQGPV